MDTWVRGFADFAFEGGHVIGPEVVLLLDSEFGVEPGLKTLIVDKSERTRAAADRQ